jgi:uncharacterized protein with von Willebrand factor type A (vWA) domain
VFVELFYGLRQYGVPVSLKEYLTLAEAVSRGLVQDLDQLYAVGRALLVKSENLFDTYDQVFLHLYKGAQPPATIRDEILDWLASPFDHPFLTPAERAFLESPEFEALRAELEKRLLEQHEQHDYGNHWIGRFGTSPFGHSGTHPGGIRIGGTGGRGQALKVAQKRLYQAYRHDRVLDTHQIQVALKKLKKLSRIGAQDELDVDASVDETCRNGGEIELIFKKRLKNNLKLILLMDVGGSMTPYATLVDTLFSAASKMQHFKIFEPYYFHNCIYENVYKNADFTERVSTADLIHNKDKEFRIVIVGDAAMAPYELSAQYGSIDYWEANRTPGIVWLKRLRDAFPHSVWLNPEIYERFTATTRIAIERVYPMYPLTLEGIGEAVDALVATGPRIPTSTLS